MLPLIRDGILFCLLTILCSSAMRQHELPSQQAEDVLETSDVQPSEAVQPVEGVEQDETASSSHGTSHGQMLPAEAAFSSHGIGTSHDIQQFMADLDFVQVQFATVLLPFEYVFEAKEAYQIEHRAGLPAEGHGAVHPRGLHVVKHDYSVKEIITNFKHLIETQCHYENGQVNDSFQQALRDSIVEFVNRVSKQTAEKRETVDIFLDKIRAEMEKRAEHEKLLANLEQVEKRLKQRQIRWHIHYIQDKQKHGNKNVVEDEATKVGFFYFLFFHSVADELHWHLAEKVNNFKGDNRKEENVLDCQLMMVEWLKKYLAKELESKIMDKILGHDKGELVKQAVMLSLKLLTSESNFDENQEIEEAFGLQKSTDDECDVNGMHTKTVEFIQSKMRKLKLEEKDYKKIAEKINSFLVIFWAPKIKPEHPLDLDTMSIQKCLGEATKEVENEINGKKVFKDEFGDELKTHQILRFYGHFYEKLLNVPNDIETSEKPEEQKKGIGKPFAHWLSNLKNELLKGPIEVHPELADLKGPLEY